MKKLINAPEDVLAESLRGLAAAHADILTLEPAGFVRRRAPKRGVALVSGGGSGHEPLHAGFVGLGMLDAAVPGEVFTAPTPDRVSAALDAVGTEAGTLLIVKNYEGDVMNFDMGAEMAADAGGASGEVRRLLVNDDVAVEDSTFTTGRRGVAGTLVVEKVVGAAAEAGASLDDCVSLGERTVRATRSMGVALTSCTVPTASGPTFQIGDDEMEFGVGIHGEPGRRREALRPADEVAREVVQTILADLGEAASGPALLFVNGFGATPAIELYLMYDAARRALEGSGVEVTRSLVGSYVTSLDMAGCSITLSMLDDERARLWDAPVHAAALRWGV